MQKKAIVNILVPFDWDSISSPTSLCLETHPQIVRATGDFISKLSIILKIEKKIINSVEAQWFLQFNWTQLIDVNELIKKGIVHRLL